MNVIVTSYLFRLLCLIVVFLGTIAPRSSYAEYTGAELLRPACDTAANPNLDGTKEQPSEGGYNYTQSCFGHTGSKGKITENNFAVQIRFDPKAASAAQGSGIIIGLSAFNPLVGGAAGLGTIVGGLATGTKEFWLKAGQAKWIATTVFEVHRKGDMACAYAKPFGLFEFTVDKADSEDGAAAVEDGTPDNCFFMPEPRSALKPPTWSPIIAPVCVQHCKLKDHDDNPATPERKFCYSKADHPFMGVIVQCVTETLDNLFYIKNPTNQKTVFEIVQLRLKTAIRALLTLYIVLFAYQFIIGKKKLSMAEGSWVILKVGLVFYFAAFDGMMVIKPALHSASQELSMLIMDAGFGRTDGFDEAEARTIIAREEVDRAQENLRTARQKLGSFQGEIDKKAKAFDTAGKCLLNIRSNVRGIPFCSAEDLCILQIQQRVNNPSVTTSACTSEVRAKIVSDLGTPLNDSEIRLINLEARIQARIDTSLAQLEAARTRFTQEETSLNVAENVAAHKAASERLSKALIFEGSFGYNMCDYRKTFYGDQPGSNLYSYTFPDGSVRVKDLTFMRLWDTLDCKFMKYFGVGDYKLNSDVPQLILLFLSMFFTNALGIPVLILGLGFIIYFSLVIMRIAHIYLMAFVGLIILIYVAPLIIPSVLFEKTKNMYNAWFKQILAYTLQPVILFAFLSFLFATFDMIIYEDNRIFYPVDYGNPASGDLREVEKVAYRNRIQLIPDLNDPLDISKGRCPDEDSMGCILQKTSDRYGKTPDFGLGSDFTFMTAVLSTSEGLIIFMALLKMMALAMIFHAVMDVIHNMSARLVDAAGGGQKGAAGMSNVPVPAPHQAVIAGAKITELGAKGVTAFGGLITRAAVGLVGKPIYRKATRSSRHKKMEALRDERDDKMLDVRKEANKKQGQLLQEVKDKLSTQRDNELNQARQDHAQGMEVLQRQAGVGNPVEAHKQAYLDNVIQSRIEDVHKNYAQKLKDAEKRVKEGEPYKKIARDANKKELEVRNKYDNRILEAKTGVKAKPKEADAKKKR